VPLYDLLYEICRLLQKKVIIPPGGATNVVVYREGIPGQIGNIYPTWASAYAAAHSLGEFCLLIIDDSLGQPVITAGSFDTSQMILSGYEITNNPIVVDVLDGAVFTAIGTVTQQIVLLSKSSQPVFTAPVGPFNNLIFASKGASFATDATAGAPFFHNPAGGQLFIVAELGGGLRNAGLPVVQADAGSFTVVVAGETSNVDDQVFTGGGQVIVNTVSTSAQIGRNQNIVPASNFIIQRQDIAELLSIDPNPIANLWNQPSWFAGAQPEAQAALANLVGRAEVFVLAPGTPNPTGRVFADLASLCAAANQAQKGPRVIWVDASLSPTPGSVQIPAGVYATGGPTAVFGTRYFGTGVTILDCADNVNLSGFFDFEDIYVRGHSTGAPILTTGSFTNDYRFTGNGGLQNLGTAPLLTVAPGASVRVTLHDHATLGSGFVVAAGPGANLDIEAYDYAQILGKTLAYSPTASGRISLDGEASLDYDQPGVPGGAILAGAVPTFLVEGTFVQSLTALGPSSFTISHGLSTRWVHVRVFDDLGKEQIPDEVICVNQKNVTVNLSSFGAFANWTVAIRR
jgi:hypothetical protein